MSRRREAALVSIALAASAVLASTSQSLWLALPLLLVALPGSWVPAAAAFLTGSILGLSPARGIVHLLLFALVIRDRDRRGALLMALFLAAAPFTLIAPALAYTGWTEESMRAISMGSAGTLGVLLSAWALQFRPARAPSALTIVVCGVVGCSIGVPASEWPAFLDLESSDEATPETLLTLLRRGAAGDVASAYGAIGLWTEEFKADLPTVRQNCPELGWLTRKGPYTDVGKAACAVAELRPESAATHPFGERFLHESLAESGRIRADAPVWLLQVTGREEARYTDWQHFNRELDFALPRPARVRGLISHGVGQTRISYAEDLGSFTLTTVTPSGGTGYFVDIPVADSPIGALLFEGVSRRGLVVEVVFEGGETWQWGCSSGGERVVSMPESICSGRPGATRWSFVEPRVVRSLRVHGEFALKRMMAEL